MPLNPPPLAALLLAVVMTLAAKSTAAMAGPEVLATVLSIGDGDTIRVQQGQQRITVRLACIDAPEMAQAPYGAQSRAYLQTRLRIGTPVTLLPQTVDRYGRTVAEVIGEVNLNLAMVEDGQAFAYRKYLGQCDAREYLDAEFRASRSRYGVCGGCRAASPVPGTSGAADRRGDQPVPPDRFLLGGRIGAVRSAPLHAPRSCCGKVTPTWMGMVMARPAKASAEGTDTRTSLLWQPTT